MATFVRHEDLDDYLDGLDGPTGNFISTPDGVFIDDNQPNPGK